MTTLTIGKDPVQITLSGHTMGSDYAVKYINWADGTPQPAPETLKAAIDDRLQQVNDEMSTYIPSSHISRINQLRDTESYTPPAARLRPCFFRLPYASTASRKAGWTLP
ncbi:FAD:protein FMN transferase [Kingella oralis]|uniref:FAD:protein FMN transferase n=1 Tax=Kingella oralis TaxID=505 RepID=UPI002D801D2B|nr:FAD:protein FMN transferase [Kingella oralis]